MAVKKAKKTIPDTSTQRYLPFSQIRENVILMKDNSSRVILRCSTINFLLKSNEEQDAIIMSFQRFLNSINFPIQIMVRSSKLDLDKYLQDLNTRAVKQKNPLLQNQTYEYIEYLKKLIEVAQIMKKEFFIVIPYDEVENESVRNTSAFGPFVDFWNSVFNNSVDVSKLRGQVQRFTKSKKGLFGRVNTIKTGLENIGIKATDLDKKELVTFLTDYYNPSLTGESLLKSDISDYNIL
ncbi:hypothetical protein OAN96_01035 [Candidatus Gracilibacteria bacterium]|nr:hypothetical protein [Candidatus Gracilibacteria bacterium]